ncbi:MAG TPA: sulfotransferase domain-containing protein [Candidatus Limnocylindrales bacterium]|nr:sulfotransferase domain-containing protein [Candidatus Limnocylindrales bacterium]
MITSLPERTRTYRCHHLDSTRWDHIIPRPDDIIITTSLKAGTTWTQRIVSLLVFQSVELPATLHFCSPWVDCRFIGGTAEMQQLCEGVQHRRFFKSHLPFDALPYWADTKYIYVGRDTRDVFMSTWNHVHLYTPMAREMLNGGENPPAHPFLEPPDDIREFWRLWMTTGGYPWETDGFPYWSHLRHARSYWDYRHLPNLLMVHYNDLKADLDGQMRRIARFLEIDVPEGKWPQLVDAATFSSMKRDVHILGPEMGMIFEGGADKFLFKGTNDRWRDVLTADDLELYEAAARRTLTPELKRWLELGAASGVVPGNR